MGLQPASNGLTHIDHIGHTVSADQFLSNALFYRSMLGLESEESLDLFDPSGVIFSRVLKSKDSRIRMSLSSTHTLGGPYNVVATFVGHQELTRTGVMLTLGDHVKLDFDLKEGGDLAEVVVTGNSLKNRTDRLGSALAITGKTFSTIPTPTRNFEQLAFLSGQSATPDVGQRNLGGFVLAGGKGGTGGFTVDGANTRRNAFGATLDGAAFTVSQEAIR